MENFVVFYFFFFVFHQRNATGLCCNCSMVRAASQCAKLYNVCAFKIIECQWDVSYTFIANQLFLLDLMILSSVVERLYNRRSTREFKLHFNSNFKLFFFKSIRNTRWYLSVCTDYGILNMWISYWFVMNKVIDLMFCNTTLYVCTAISATIHCAQKLIFAQ